MGAWLPILLIFMGGGQMGGRGSWPGSTDSSSSDSTSSGSSSSDSASSSASDTAANPLASGTVPDATSSATTNGNMPTPPSGGSGTMKSSSPAPEMITAALFSTASIWRTESE